MRVTSVELRPEGSSDVIQLSFRDPRSQNPYQVKSIAPLDADDLTPQFYGTSGDSSKKYYDLVLKKREPVVLIGLNPRFGALTESSYSELRDRLYRLISSSRTGVVQIVFQNDGVDVAAISGTVSKVEAGHFTKTPEVQLTFSCSNPMLRSPSRFILVGTDERPPVTDDDLTIVDEFSNAVSGFRFEAMFSAPAATFVIAPSAVSPEWTFTLQPHGGFLTGDVLHFSSEFGNRYLYVQRGATRVYLADVVQEGSIWPLIFPGSNPFHVNHVVTWQTIDHYLTYWGV